MHSIELLTNFLLLTLINYSVLPSVFPEAKYFIDVLDMSLNIVLSWEMVISKNIQEAPRKFNFCAEMIFKNSQCSFKVFASADEFDWSCFFFFFFLTNSKCKLVLHWLGISYWNFVIKG